MEYFRMKTMGEFDLTKFKDQDFMIDEILCGTFGLKSVPTTIKDTQRAIGDFVNDGHCYFYGDKVDDVNYLLNYCISPTLCNIYKDIIMAIYLLKSMQELGD